MVKTALPGKLAWSTFIINFFCLEKIEKINYFFLMPGIHPGCSLMLPSNLLEVF